MSTYFLFQKKIGSPSTRHLSYQIWPKNIIWWNSNNIITNTTTVNILYKIIATLLNHRLAATHSKSLKMLCSPFLMLCSYLGLKFEEKKGLAIQ